MTRKSLTKISKRIILASIIIGLLSVHFIFPRFITEVRNPILESFKTKKVINTIPKKHQNPQFKRKKITITTFDNLKLSALLTYSNLADTKGTIILLHGSSNTKEHFHDLSEFLSLNGFNSVALDSRGFGESEGQFTTFGAKETKDIQALITELINIEDLDNIGLWGQSIGGAFTLQTMGLDKRVKYGIAESSYTDLKTNIQHFFQRHLGFSINPLSNYITNRAATIADFDPDEANPLKYSKEITQPILVVHGAQDLPIPIEEGKANFANIKSKDKKFLKIESAGHSDIWEIGGENYFNSVLEFLNKHALKTN